MNKGCWVFPLGWRGSVVFFAFGVVFPCCTWYNRVIVSLGGLSRGWFPFCLSVRPPCPVLCVWARVLPGRPLFLRASLCPVFFWLGRGGCLPVAVLCPAFCPGLPPGFLPAVLCGSALWFWLLGFCPRGCPWWWRGSVPGSFLLPPSGSGGCGAVFCPGGWFFRVAVGGAGSSPLGVGWGSRLACPFGGGGVRPGGRFRSSCLFWLAVLGFLGRLFWSGAGCLCPAVGCLGRRGRWGRGVPVCFPLGGLPGGGCSWAVFLRSWVRLLGVGCLGRGFGLFLLCLAARWGCRPVLAVSFGWGLVRRRPCWPSVVLVRLVRLF